MTGLRRNVSPRATTASVSFGPAPACARYIFRLRRCFPNLQSYKLGGGSTKSECPAAAPSFSQLDQASVQRLRIFHAQRGHVPAEANGPVGKHPQALFPAVRSA